MKADHAQVNRLLKTARGQIDGILKMVEEDRYCLDVSSQIMAAQSILKKANRMVLRAHMDCCVREAAASGRGARARAAGRGALLGREPGAPALVVGLGNRAITPDNIGPKAADQTMVTRHLVERVPEHFGSFRPVAALAAGVLGTTGMESGEVVRAVAEQIKPACVVAVDALASRSLRRVCRTIQLADTGITPGSGVGNARAALNAETLGVPVIAVGVPTVVDAATLTCDVLAEAGKGELNPAALQGAGNGLIVTPKDIDTQVHDLAKVIGYGINLALHTGLTIEDVELFLS
ncbi:MAG: GPR endopeptidase [Flavonifractor sp.]|nr:GPR endopeptidase [Flavonifractor sp.]